ncbi:MAG: M56 family metallopeptidase [Patescibacteria group bacterium]
MPFLTACTSILGFVVNPRHLLVTGIGLAVFLAFIFSVIRQYAATRVFMRLLRPDRDRDATETLRSALAELEIQEKMVSVIDSADLLCFCAGLLRPRMYISRGALQALSREELVAVLAHEYHHLRKWDPLRSAFLRALKNALFFIPVVHYLERRHEVAKEVSADAEAMRRGQGKLVLASALYKLSGTRHSGIPVLAPFADCKVLETRISFLAGRGLIPVTLTPKAFGASLVVIAAFFLLAVHPSRAEAPPQEPCRSGEAGWAILVAPTGAGYRP